MASYNYNLLSHIDYQVIPTKEKISMVAFFGETMQTKDQTEVSTIYVGFTIEGQSWIDSVIVQNWASIEDLDNLGTFQTFTCTTQHQYPIEMSELYEVNNYYGEMSFSAEKTPCCFLYDSINIEDQVYDGPWKPEIGNIFGASTSKFDGDKNEQTCVATRIIKVSHGGIDSDF